MINWVITFLLLACVSAIFGFGGALGENVTRLGQVGALTFLIVGIVLIFRSHDRSGLH